MEEARACTGTALSLPSKHGLPGWPQCVTYDRVGGYAPRTCTSKLATVAAGCLAACAWL
ncbi:hypothetical protein PTI98_009337 [Pleurotus ostreatus]|nr:hypothetical protein PTI98_009337 [Pleurotus ostreatus]